MSFDAIVGGQWGDEGKGKIVDLLSKNVDVVARYQGGANAGHTVYLEDKKIVYIKFQLVHFVKIVFVFWVMEW